jgi:hypothetical protein
MGVAETSWNKKETTMDEYMLAYYQGLADAASSMGGDPSAFGDPSMMGGGYLDESGGYADEQGGYYDSSGGYLDASGGYYDAYGNYTDADTMMAALSGSPF